MKTLKLVAIALCLFGFNALNAQSIETDSLMLIDMYIDYDKPNPTTQTHFIQLEKTKIKVNINFDRSASPKLIEAICNGRTYSFNSRDQKNFTSQKTKASFVVESITDNPRKKQRRVLLRLRNAAVLR